MHSGINWSTMVYLKYAYRLYVKFGVSKQVIIIDDCLVKSWFTFANLQNLSLKLPRPNIIVFHIVLCI